VRMRSNHSGSRRSCACILGFAFRFYFLEDEAGAWVEGMTLVSPKEDRRK
jgi:hypothetical protein